jgi:hypothetical protein
MMTNSIVLFLLSSMLFLLENYPQEATNLRMSPSVEKGYIAVLLSLQYAKAQEETEIDCHTAQELTSEAIKQLKDKKIETLTVWQNRVRSKVSPEAETRLLELYVQREGYRAALNPFIAKLAGITDERLALLYHDSDVAGEKAMKLAMESFKEPGNDAAISKATMVNDAVLDVIMNTLSEDEVKALRAMHGKPVVLPKSMQKFGSRSVMRTDGQAGSGMSEK